MGQCLVNKRLRKGRLLIGHLYHIWSPQGVGLIEEDEMERLWVPKIADIRSEVYLSNMVGQLHSGTDGGCDYTQKTRKKIKLAQIQAWLGKDL